MSGNFGKSRPFLPERKTFSCRRQITFDEVFALVFCFFDKMDYSQKFKELEGPSRQSYGAKTNLQKVHPSLTNSTVTFDNMYTV